MGMRAFHASLLGSVSICLAAGTAAKAQTTPGDQSGTPQAAGAGQSAATPTNAPATPGTQPRSDLGSPNDIIVTARRVEERLQDVPISITVFNQQQLTNRNVVQAVDLATYTPSLSAGTNFGSQNAAFSLRGFYQDIGTQPSVGVYFADVVAPRGAANNIPIGDGAGPGDFFDLQNVQVLKGPQGTLFGRNTTGGAILLVPQKPTSRLEGYVEGSYGNYDLKRIQAVMNVPLSDKARFRIGVDHEDRAGYVTNNSGIGPRHFNDIGYTAVRASFVVDLTPDLENYTIATYLRSDTHGDLQKITGSLTDANFANPITRGSNFLGQLATAQLAREAGTGFFTSQNPQADPRTLLTTWRVINTTTWRASDSITLKNIVSYAELRESYRNPLFGTDFDLYDSTAGRSVGVSPGTRIGFASSVPLPGGQTAAQSTATEEFQVQGTGLASKLTYQIGGYIEISDPLFPSGSQSPVLTNCSNSASFICNNPIGAGNINYTVASTHFRNYGTYAQATYSLTEQLKLTGGIRYTWDRVNDVNYLRSYAFPFGPAQSATIGYTCNDPVIDPTFHQPGDTQGCRNTLKEKSQRPTWLVDVDYKPGENVLLYAKWSRGYRAGGLAPQAPTGFKTFSPEKVDTYEVGAKTSVPGPLHATFDVAGFYNDFRNQQLLSALEPLNVGLSSASGIINAGKSRIWGVETEASITPFRGFTLDGAYTYLNTKLQRVTNINTTGGSNYLIVFPAQPGEPLPLSPRHKATVTGTYTLPLPDKVGRLSFGATLVYTSRQLNNYFDEQPYYLAPLRVGSVTVPGVGTIPAAALGGTIVPCPASAFGCEQVAVPDYIRRQSYQRHRALVNLNLNWNKIAGSHFDLQLFATNVLNKHYFAYVAGLVQSTQFETSQYAEPRMYGARLRFSFGG